ncbi:MAG: hypothetical protein R2850_08180 [Bacteroidia bacterium]
MNRSGMLFFADYPIPGSIGPVKRKHKQVRFTVSAIHAYHFVSFPPVGVMAGYRHFVC